MRQHVQLHLLALFGGAVDAHAPGQDQIHSGRALAQPKDGGAGRMGLARRALDDALSITTSTNATAAMASLEPWKARVVLSRSTASALLLARCNFSGRP